MINLEDVYQAVREILPKGELFAVGGCVRDTLLNKQPKDWDFCTNLTPEQMKPLIEKAGRHYYGIGEKFGTVGFKVPINDVFVYVEVTTYRSEKYTPGSRKPEVIFGNNLREDLKRRDFTINSLAFDGKEIIDLFAGELDLNHKLIKSVGEPRQMINDDPLRILRAIRFSVQLDFDIEQNLERHLGRFCTKLFDVAIERQVVELDKMFSINPRKSLLLLNKIGYIRNFIPELIEESHVKIPTSLESEDVDIIWKKILSHTGESWRVDDITGELVLTNNNHARTKFINEGVCSRFKFSNKRKNIILGKEK